MGWGRYASASDWNFIAARCCLIALFLLVVPGFTPDGLQYEQIYAFADSWLGKACLFIVVSLSLWHAAHRLRVVFHDFGVRKNGLITAAVYLVATAGTVMTAFLYLIN